MKEVAAGKVFKIKENSLRNFGPNSMAVVAPLQGALHEHATKPWGEAL